MPIEMLQNETAGEAFTLADWENTLPEMFDAREAAEAELMPLIDAVMAKAGELGVPLALVGVTGQDDRGAYYLFRQQLISIRRAHGGILAVEPAAKGDLQYVASVMQAAGTRAENMRAPRH